MIKTLALGAALLLADTTDAPRASADADAPRDAAALCAAWHADLGERLYCEWQLEFLRNTPAGDAAWYAFIVCEESYAPDLVIVQLCIEDMTPIVRERIERAL